MSDLHYRSIAELHQAYAGGSLSPVEVAEAFLTRIDRLDGRLHSYITVTPEAALDAARASERRYAAGRALGPLDGVPIGLKDLYDTAGVRTTAASPLYAERIPREDATAVRRLKLAGAVLVGKHTMYEFAVGRPLPDSLFPAARNPWDLERIPGGSSSGSAVAVAVGLCAAALGTDTGGSIRIPSSYCGIVGMKATYGRVSCAGVIPLSWSLDHAGPMTRTVEDAALLLGAVAGHDALDPASAGAAVPDYATRAHAGVRGVRIGAIREVVARAEHMTEEAAGAYDAALRQLTELGAIVRDVDLSAAFARSPTAFGTIVLSEALSFHRKDFGATPERYGRKFRERLLDAAKLTGADYVDAMRVRAQVVSEVREVMRAVDLLVTPTMVWPAPRFSEDEDRYPQKVRTLFTNVFNVTGLPAMTVPCGFSADGLPLGLQIVARPFEEHVAFAAGHSYEQATTWKERRPSAF